MKIQQGFLLTQINTLTRDIQLKSKGQIANKHRSTELIWTRFTNINLEIFTFFDQLRAVNRVWTSFVSVYFVGHTLILVFLFYSLVFDDAEFEFLKKSYFIYFVIEFAAILLAITNACSVVVRHNIMIYKTNTIFCYHFIRSYQPNVFYLLKVRIRIWDAVLFRIISILFTL